MKLSIVTISYNQGEYLRRCIDSVLSQSYEDIEYIVVDAGSSDGSRDIIDSYGDKIITVYESDDGPADGLNKGFARATGSVFAYINSDDYFFPGAFDKAINYLEEKKCDVICGNGWVVDANDKKLHRCFSHKFSLKQYALGNCVAVQQSTFFKRDFFDVVGGFNVNNKVSWDGELLVDMVIAGATVFRIFDFISAFRVYDDSISGSGNFLYAAKAEHNKIAEKISNVIGAYCQCMYLQRIVYRLADPKLVFFRGIDQVVNGKRKIPS